MNENEMHLENYSVWKIIIYYGKKLILVVLSNVIFIKSNTLCSMVGADDSHLL